MINELSKNNITPGGLIPICIKCAFEKFTYPSFKHTPKKALLIHNQITSTK